MEGRADKCRGAFCDGCDRPGLVGISRRDPAQLRWAFMYAHAGRRSTVTHPLLDAWAAYQVLLTTLRRVRELKARCRAGFARRSRVPAQK